MNFLFAKQKILLLLIVIIISVISFSNYLFAYDEIIVHPSLTQEMAKLYNLNFGDKLTEQEINWIKQGSVDEDKVFGGIKQIRSSNHFYNPSGIKEWKDYNLDSKISAYFSSGIGNGSKKWAHDSVAQSQYVGGDYTWERAVYDYVNGDKKHAYESLGHILHLIEDKTVPAHTRNDFHLSPKELEAYQTWLVIRNFVDYEPYETWTGNQARLGGLKFNFSDSLFQQNKKPTLFANLDSYFDDVAIYANTKFFSKDTIYVYLEPNNNTVEGKERLVNGDIVDYVYEFDENNVKFKLAKIFKNKNTGQGVYDVSDKTPEVHSDYWSRLAPKSILAGAGIIKLFKDEVKKASQNPVAIQKPDTFTTYYFTKPAAKTAVAVNLAMATAANNIVSGLNQIKDKISYSLTPSASSNYTLVFDMSQAIPASSITLLGGVIQVQAAKDVASIQSQISQEPIYGAALVSQSEPEIIIEPNKEISLSAQFKNTGAAGWQQDKIYLNVYLKNDAANQFYHSSWLTSVRPAKLAEPQVVPNSFGNFNFLVGSPPTAGEYFFKVRPVWQDNERNFKWLSDSIVSWRIRVKSPNIAQPESKSRDENLENITDTSKDKGRDTNTSTEIPNNIAEENKTPSQNEGDIEKGNEAKEANKNEESQDSADNTEKNNTDNAEIAAPVVPTPLVPFYRRGLDNTSPETAISENPAVKTSANTASFKFSSSEENSTFLCDLDNADFVSCGANKTYENLSDGSHTLKVKAVDVFTNVDEMPAEFSWTIDSVPPAKITNLAAVAGSARGKIKLSWTKPEENVSYEIRYAEEKEVVETGLMANQTNWQDAAQISESIDNGVEQIEIGSLTSLVFGKTYYFAIKSKDELNNISEISNSPSSSANTEVDHIVISEIQIDSINGVGGTNDDWIELYNPTANEIPLSGWSIQRQTKNGTLAKRNFEANSKISAHSFFLLVSTQAAQELLSKKDLTFSTFDLTDDNVIYLVSNNEEIIDANDSDVVDKLGWGSEALFAETSVAGNPLDGGSLERKANYSSTAESMSGGADKFLGNGWDSDNNSADFVLRTVSDPQNASSAVEPRYAPVKISDFSATGATGDSHAVKLTWSAPYGAFGNQQNLSYDIRYSTTAIDSQNFSSATSALPIPSVGASGAAQELTIGNLSLSQTYYFAIKTKDITGGITGPESEISFASYYIPSPVFLQNWGEEPYFALSTNCETDGTNCGGFNNWPKVSQTIGSGFDQALKKATASVKCNSDSSCNIGYKIFAVNGYLDAGYTQAVQGDGGGFLATGGLGDDPYWVSANSTIDVNFSGWSPFTFNPVYYYKITFGLNIDYQRIEWGGSSIDSYPSGNSTDYSGGADIYFKLSTE